MNASRWTLLKKVNGFGATFNNFGIQSGSVITFEITQSGNIGMDITPDSAHNVNVGW